MQVSHWRSVVFFRSWLDPKAHRTPHTPQLDARIPFSTTEWDSLQDEDYAAARNFIAIMASVFSLGLIGYSIVAFVASRGWGL